MWVELMFFNRLYGVWCQHHFARMVARWTVHPFCVTRLDTPLVFGLAFLLVADRSEFVLRVSLSLHLTMCSTMFSYLFASIGPIAQYHENSRYYSAIPPRPNKIVDNHLPHVTVQMPVYKESLEKVLAPSIESIKRAMQTYARQGGTSTIFVNDDGMQLLSAPDRDARIAFYANHGIGWIARPKHDESSKEGYKRAGRFKKASNMNYGLRVSLRLEKHLAELQREREGEKASGVRNESQGGRRNSTMNNRFASRSSNVGGGSSSAAADDNDDMALEDRALQLAVEEEFASTGHRHRPWAAHGRGCRVGEIVLIVDSDTLVPEDCFRDAARELAACPTVAIIQHESDVMQVAHHYFENGMTYFTKRINKCISMSALLSSFPICRIYIDFDFDFI